MRWVRTESLKTDADLAAVFPIRDETAAAIAQSMQEIGYDQAEPIVVWEGAGVIVDGHTRFAASKSVGLDRVYVDERPFEDKRDALEYAIRRQRDRRNLSNKELAGFIFRAMETLDRVKPSGQRTDLVQDRTRSVNPNERKSAAETAAKIGVGQTTIAQVRAVMASDDEETKQALRNGETTVSGAYKTVKQAETAKKDSAPEPLILSVQPALDAASSPEIRSTYSAAEWQALTVEEKACIVEFAPIDGRATFNQVNENIDWAKWSWNPVTGCLHNCEYCYARDIAERFYAQKFVPTFIPSRLHAPRHQKVPAAADGQIGWKNVFTCSMADLFGKWVPQEWIDAVFDEVRHNPQWNFLFLTKFPRRLAELDWPENAWCGASVDRQHRVADTEAAFRGVKAGVKWLSCEPMMERLTFTSLEMFDWVVIGAASKSTQTPEFQPPWEWVEHLLNQARAAGCRVYIKPNLRSRPQEYPGEIRP